MKTFLSQVGSVVLGVLVIAALIGGCALYERGKDLLPGPARAVVDSFDSAGPGGFVSGDLRVADSSEVTTSPLDACPEYADDVDVLANAAQGGVTAEQAEGNEIADLLAAQIDRLQEGGTPAAPSATGVDAALARQNELLAGVADRVRAVTYNTSEVQSLSSSFAAALEAVARANQKFLDGGTGTRTRSAWMNWASEAGAPSQQIEAISSALSKCPG
jgi:hypothetical protein